MDLYGHKMSKTVIVIIILVYLVVVYYLYVWYKKEKYVPGSGLSEQEVWAHNAKYSLSRLGSNLHNANKKSPPEYRGIQFAQVPGSKQTGSFVDNHVEWFNPAKKEKYMGYRSMMDSDSLALFNATQADLNYEARNYKETSDYNPVLMRSLFNGYVGGNDNSFIGRDYFDYQSGQDFELSPLCPNIKKGPSGGDKINCVKPNAKKNGRVSALNWRNLSSGRVLIDRAPSANCANNSNCDFIDPSNRFMFGKIMGLKLDTEIKTPNPCDPTQKCEYINRDGMTFIAPCGTYLDRVPLSVY